MVQDDGPVGLDAVRVAFDDVRVVSDVGVMLVASLAQRLRIEVLAQRLGPLRRDRPGAANVGRKVMALLLAMVLGTYSIDDCDVLRAGRTRRLLGGWLPAPSTLGTFLRAFTFGRVRQLARLLGQALERAWKAGAGPGDGRLVSTASSARSAAGSRRRRLRLHASARLPPDPGHARRHPRDPAHPPAQGIGQPPEGNRTVRDELSARMQRAGATGIKLQRADSGFWKTNVFERLKRAGWQYSIGGADNQDRPRRRRRDRRALLAADRRLRPTAARRRSPRPSTAVGG